MTLYEFNRLSEDEQLKTVWSIGIFLDNNISKTERLSCYAIDMFFVELIYEFETDKIIEVWSFKSGLSLYKHSPNFKTEY
jgi:hypothetical protein